MDRERRKDVRKITRREALSTAAKIGISAGVAFAVGIIGGYFAGWATAPRRTVTSTVSTTVPTTVTKMTTRVSTVTSTVPTTVVRTTTKTETVTTTVTPVIPKVYGWMGKYLDVDLSTGTVRVRDVPKDLREEWIGGRGLGVKIIADEIGKRFDEIDPLGPENILVIATGPLTGTDAPTSGRYVVVSKSPLTGGIFDSNSGGHWAPAFKGAGFDYIVFRGVSEDWVYLWVHDGEAELVKCPELAGKTTSETTAAIKKKHPGARVLCIGPAGERLVKNACVINDADEEGLGRAAGRCGGGAVMGSKRIKAIAAAGAMKPAIADPTGFTGALTECKETIARNAVTGKVLPDFGTPALVEVINDHGILPTCNFQYGMFDYADKIGAGVMKEKLVGLHPCFNCPIMCGRIVSVGGGKWETGEGPEYESIWALGADCGVGDPYYVYKAGYMCNDLGLDTISAGATIACAMELGEKGLVDELKAAGFKFGDGELLCKYIEKMAKREGLGDKLAEGSWKLCEAYGIDPRKYSISSRKLEWPAYDPRGSTVHGLGYITSHRGGCHVRAYMVAPETWLAQAWGPEGRFTWDGPKIEALITTQNFVAVVDSSGLCLFSTFALGPDHFSKLLSAATGVDYSVDKLMKIGEKIWNLERLLDNKVGYKDEEQMPERMFEPMPEESWPSLEKKNVVKIVEGWCYGAGGKCYTKDMLKKMLDKYYELRGWVDGVPTDEKLRELGLTRL